MTKNTDQMHRAQLVADVTELEFSPLIAGGVADHGSSVPAHYGNPFREEAELISGKGFTDLSFLEVLSVSGADRKKWLHALTTCAFTQLATGQSAEMLVLSPYGHIEHAAAVIDDGERVWMLLDSGRAAELAEFLAQMKFMMRVEIQIHDFAVIGFGTQFAQVPENLRTQSVFAWEDPWPAVIPGGAHYGVAAQSHPGAELRRTMLAFSNRSQLRQNLLAAMREAWQPAGLIAWEAARIRAWRPRPNNEMRERVLPHELDLLRSAVHLEKGCYRGQETVAKLVNLGKPPRRLTYLYIEAPEDPLPEAGAPIFCGKRKVGTLTSIVRDSEEGPIGLALIKRAVDPHAILTIGAAMPEADGSFAETTQAPAILATQVEIVTHNGKSSVSPAQRPGNEFLGHRRQS
ncbi:YgfZ/GcvT domain-containing protein [Arcanobacterium hippocoleae]|uniref:CAF17-like 4Fe-4S cluster assembly/insertion protein YgfZ n=1 Tax=Arcanobacterium hippocoleae TaxID=149017 RepID=UPI003672DF25